MKMMAESPKLNGIGMVSGKHGHYPPKAP